MHAAPHSQCHTLHTATLILTFLIYTCHTLTQAHKKDEAPPPVVCDGSMDPFENMPVDNWVPPVKAGMKDKQQVGDVFYRAVFMLLDNGWFVAKP